MTLIKLYKKLNNYMNKQQIKNKMIKLGLKTNWQHFWTMVIMLSILVAFSVISWLLFIEALSAPNLPYNEEKIENGIIYHNEQENLSEAQILPNSALVEQDTERLIILLAIQEDFPVEVALKIAECESQYGKYNHNWEGGSAKGVYQFTDLTWENYCDGNVLNEEDNIKCFLKLYKVYPNWWACNQ